MLIAFELIIVYKVLQARVVQHDARQDLVGDVRRAVDVHDAQAPTAAEDPNERGLGDLLAQGEPQDLFIVIRIIVIRRKRRRRRRRI